MNLLADILWSSIFLVYRKKKIKPDKQKNISTARHPLRYKCLNIGNKGCSYKLKFAALPRTKKKCCQCQNTTANDAMPRNISNE
jgi:hypothetical protein